MIAFDEGPDVTEVEEIPVGELDDDEIASELIRVLSEAADIERQIKDDAELGCSRGESWRVRAYAARRHLLKRGDLLKAEAGRRGLDTLVIDPEKERARQFRREELVRRAENRAANERQFAEAEKRRAEKAARHDDLMRVSKQREQDKPQMFLAAACEILSKDQRAVIWNRAQEMFPDSPAWAEWARL